MNYKIMGRFCAQILTVEWIFMIPALILSVYDGESQAVFGFGVSILIIAAVTAALFFLGRGAKTAFFAREGMVCVGIRWMLMSLMGSLPFWLSGEIPKFIDALFEITSGFSTTGCSILIDVEELSRGILYWRSFSHWLGGMGVLVFLLCLLPLTGNGYHMNLMKAESPGPSVTKLVPKVQSTAKILYGLYLFLTVMEFVLLLVGQMPVFDSLCTVFGTAGTGGFGIKNDSFGSYSTYLQGVVTVFMILFGINFNVYFLFYMKKPKEALRCEEARWYLGIIAASILVITFFVRDFFDSLFLAFHHVAFQVASIITTTGFATVDFNLWPTIPKTILVLLMFIGACAGSTGGGIKVSRVVLLFRSLTKELSQSLHPNQVRKIHFEGRAVDHVVLRSVNVFMAAYILIFAISVLLIGIDNFDLVTNFTAVAATLNNIGPGLELVGPAQNFGLFSNFSKLVLTFDMLAGRLELFPLLLLFYRGTWKRF